jgi:hypothetical protein
MMAAKSSTTTTGRSWPARHPLLFTFLLSAVIVWAMVTVFYMYYYPHLIYNAYKRGILVEGGGNGPIPVNTLYTEPQALFSDPLHPPASASKLLTTGVNHDTLLTVGWLDLSKGPQVLHVPDMDGRYYSVQLTDPADFIDFAYVGTRTTGTKAGEYLISGPGWTGAVPQGMTQISSPGNSVLVAGRVLVESDSDLATAYDLSKQIQVTPLRFSTDPPTVFLPATQRNP